ncbi:putative disease resistance protein At3g14460 isoform X2 [Quercus robur]|uniref:putative disease resistance protein At3g14460 isoform X2 n=1 Tax=Quercus robur TaxID=38942 RepID=UPI002163CA7E|nr:putative disease resistance protein At3g14460 isoform X2 [Quercus robur]
MAGPWVEGAIQALLERLASAELIDLFQRLTVKDELVEKLKTALLSLDAVLNDAQEKQRNNPTVEKWLYDVTNTLYVVDDALDQISTEALLKKLTKNRVGNLRWEIESSMEQVNEMIDSYAKQSNELGLIGGSGTQYDKKQFRTASSVDEAEVVFGRESDKEAIIDLFMGASGEPLSLIVIVAKDGIGKTTLARLVYEEDRVSKHFDLKAWAWVPAEGTVGKACSSIFESFTLECSDLEKQRFLIVLDDVSSKSLDLYLEFPFRAAAKGSCIIVTTSDQAVESIMRTYTYFYRPPGTDTSIGKELLPPGQSPRFNTYDMNRLSDEECWSIFTKYAFGDENSSSYPELEDIGRQIVKVCGGLPLAVRTIGTFLRSKLQVEEWVAVLDRQKHFHFTNEMSGIGLALGLSYDNLPVHLKRCFAYCSIFPPGYEFEKEKLVLLWMAEGLLPQPEKNKRIEEVGDDCFKELLCRSFFQQSSGNKSHFVMHSLTDDLARAVSGRCCFRLEDGNSFGTPTISVRYLSISRSDSLELEIFEYIRKLKRLRTFLTLDHISWDLHGYELGSNIFSRMSFLRVLSVSHYELTKLPASISDLKHLRYIDLSDTEIKSLPESVCFLPNLQTLILSNCDSLAELPQNMGRLINLRHLHISGTNLKEMPKNMSRLESLQTLSNFVVGKESGSTVTELREFLNLHGALCISKLQNVASAKDAAEANLVEKPHLDELVLEWGDHTVDLENDGDVLDDTGTDDTVGLENDGDVLEQLVPHTNLKKLSISFYSGTRFPHWLGDSSFSNLFFLCLSSCKNCIDLPLLGQLPSLKVLIIKSMNAVKKVGPEFYGMDKPFQSLETLTFDRMLEWEEWIALEVEGGEFPCLRELCIRRCPKLKGNLPKQLPSVVKVEISESQELLTALMTEASLHKRLLDYHDKILFMTGYKATSFSKQMTVTTYEGAAESSIPMTEGAIESSLFIIATDSSLPMTQGATAAESSLPMTQGTVTVEHSSAMTQAATESSLPMTQGAAESSLPTTQTPNIRNEADVPINTQSNQDSLQDLFSFKSLKVSEISQLRKLPMGLHSLKIEGCDALEFIPEQVMVSNPPIQHLYIISCCSLKSFSGGSPPTALKFLYIQNCKKLKFLPLAEKTHHYALLEHLCIGSSCDSLVFLPLDLFPKLKILSIWDCANLESFSMPGRIQKDLTSLEVLEIRDCPNLLSFPRGGLLTPNLKSIWFSNCKNLKELPDQLHTLSSLRSMFINNCPELLSLPEGGLPSNLSLLCITFCDKMMLGMEWGLHRLDYLSRLEIEGACKNVVSFPEAKLLPRNLNSLRISGLLNLKYLNYRGLQHLTALKILEISCCNKLQSLPEEGLPASLSFLCIKECSLLKLKLQDKTGKDWSKIAHISCIEIDEEVCHEEV